MLTVKSPNLDSLPRRNPSSDSQMQICIRPYVSYHSPGKLATKSTDDDSCVVHYSLTEYSHQYYSSLNNRPHA